jgi:Abortive infection C-terminus
VPEIADAWRKALDRVESDPSGAITAARTLAEHVCKHILRELGENPGNRDELPILWRRVADRLNLSPAGYEDENMRALLGSLAQVASRVAALRSDLGDAHAVDHRAEVRHARLAVNAAGTLSVFAMEALGAQQSKPDDAGFFDFNL